MAKITPGRIKKARGRINRSMDVSGVAALQLADIATGKEGPIARDLQEAITLLDNADASKVAALASLGDALDQLDQL